VRAGPEYPPGTDGLWTFVFIDMLVFLMIFLTFMGDRLGKPALYAASQQHLNEYFGLANTLILITSSWMVVEAVQAARTPDGRRCSRYLSYALLLGMVFIGNKVVEYTLEIRSGVTPVTNPFYSYYFFITFVHLMHVIAGVIAIALFRTRVRAAAGAFDFQKRLENVGLFWHFVDVLWVFIFPLLYLVGRP
jgi:nitric oxide reductase NorE protein